MVENQSSTQRDPLRESVSNHVHVSCWLPPWLPLRGFIFSFLNHFLARCFSWTSAYPPFTNITPFLFTWFFLLLLSGNIPPRLPDRCHTRCRPRRADALSMKSRQTLWVKWKQLLAVARQLQIWLIPQPRPSSTDTSTPPPPNPQNNPWSAALWSLWCCRRAVCTSRPTRVPRRRNPDSGQADDVITESSRVCLSGYHLQNLDHSKSFLSLHEIYIQCF